MKVLESYIKNYNVGLHVKIPEKIKNGERLKMKVLC